MGLSRVARDEPSGSASGEEGGLGISVGVEEEEQAFSIRVRKKVSGVFWTSEEALTTCFFPRTTLFFCVAALELAHGLGLLAMHAGCMCSPATACAWFVTRPI